MEEIRLIKTVRISKGESTVTYRGEVWEEDTCLAIFPVAAASSSDAAAQTLATITRLYESFIEDDIPY